MDRQSIAIYGREFNESVIPFVRELFEYLDNKPLNIYIYKEFYTFLKKKINCPDKYLIYSSNEDLPQVSFMLSLGGDGTMLSAVSIIRNTGIPIAGINFGRLGFLAHINKAEIRTSLDLILAEKYSLQPRTLLMVESENSSLFGGDNFALNDITIFRHDSSSMITINVKLNGELLNSYWADGIIIATPTGSTAYSLSCGGPIIMPGSDNFVITPISPHNLNVRPIVISSSVELDLEIESRTDKYVLSCDSKNETLSVNQTLRVKKAPFNINLIRLKEESYFSTLREKLLWGIDVRNY